MYTGLTSAEANERFKKFGPNELASSKPKNIWHVALEVMKEPMFLLLIACGAMYMILGNFGEGGILMSTTLLIIFITFYQHQKTERALSALKQLASPRALVLRDGKEIRIAGRDVVPDDIIFLNEGDRIPADGLVIQNINLTVDESIITGESVPVLKSDETGKNSAIYSGTLVVQGKGLAKVTATGASTQFGQIGTSLQTIENNETRLQKEMKKLIRNLFFIGAFISIGVVIAFYFTRDNLVQSLLIGLSSAMAILPEEFPVVLAVFLALGAWRLSGNNVLTRKPSAIETLGSATVLCTDKTGTITQNKMEVVALYDGQKLFEKNELEKEKQAIESLIIAALFASQRNSIEPMEKAIDQFSSRIKVIDHDKLQLVKEYPLAGELLAMTRVVKDNSQNQISVSCKGAPEAVFHLCKMKNEETVKHLKIVHSMAQQGYRVIAVATSNAVPNILPDSQTQFDFHFLGLIGLEDPLRPEVPQALKECKEAGIKVIMITGDYPETARSIGRQIGLNTNEEILSGNELKKLTDEELKEKISNVSICARVVPDQKLRIVRALKANKAIVAMTGDGVNDAPALKAADIGIAMGRKGTDVAREASSLVLLDDNFASIVYAIRSGRRIFDNLQKAMSYILAIHIPIIGLTLLPAFATSLPILLMPLHIVFMELIIDPVCSIAFENEKEEKGIMKRPPRNPDKQFFGFKKIASSITQGLLLLTMVVVVYFQSISEGHNEDEVRAIAFSSLIVGNIFLILTNLSRTRSIIAVLSEKNVSLLITISIALLILFLTISIPSLQHLFNFQFPGYKHFISSAIGAISILIILEAIKFLKKGKYKSFY